MCINLGRTWEQSPDSGYRTLHSSMVVLYSDCLANQLVTRGGNGSDVGAMMDLVACHRVLVHGARRFRSRGNVLPARAASWILGTNRTESSRINEIVCGDFGERY